MDTSVLLGIEFSEPDSKQLAGRLASFETLVAANLLEAEFRCALLREGRAYDPILLSRIGWICPERELAEEIGRVLATGTVRGADCWHLAAALYFAEDPGTLAFFTLDQQQGRIAKALGFRGNPK